MLRPVRPRSGPPHSGRSERAMKRGTQARIQHTAKMRRPKRTNQQKATKETKNKRNPTACLPSVSFLVIFVTFCCRSCFCPHFLVFGIRPVGTACRGQKNKDKKMRRTHAPPPFPTHPLSHSLPFPPSPSCPSRLGALAVQFFLGHPGSSVFIRNQSPSGNFNTPQGRRGSGTPR